MISFQEFPVYEQELLMKLPYRVGMWMSLSDDGGGDEADEREKRAMEVLITAYVQDFCKSEFVQIVMEKTVAHKQEWGAWEEDLDQVPDECSQALTFLSDKLEDKEFRAFRDNLYEIGYSVAIAYRELDDAVASVRFGTYFKLWIAKILSALKGEVAPSEDEFLNISESEHEALDVLSRALSPAIVGADTSLTKEDDILEQPSGS